MINALMTKNRTLIFIAALALTPVAPLLAQDGGDNAPAEPASSPAPHRTEAAGTSLLEAYQREFAFLEAQRRSLENRIAETRARNAQLVSDLQAEVNQAQNALVRLDGEVERVREQVNQASEQVQVNADNAEVLAATFQQASATLEQYGIETLESDGFANLDDAAKVRTVFAQGQALIERLASIRTEPGTFYATDGTEVTGDILYIGNIAAYGKADDVAGVLAPAGNQRLKVWPVDADAATREIFAGGGGDMIPVFLFESLAREVQTKKEKTALDVINEGGTIGWVIVVLGAIGVVMIVLRTVFLKRASASTTKLASSIADMVRAGRTDEALARCQKSRSAPARVVAAAVRNLDKQRDHMEDIVSEAILHESAHLNRFGIAILVIAAVAPLLGLLGTVTGMISTFDIITEFGTGDPKLLSGGIAIALVTTELGLIVAIPTLLAGNLLSGWAERIKDDMEQAALHVINVSQDRKLHLAEAA